MISLTFDNSVERLTQHMERAILPIIVLLQQKAAN